MKRIPAARRHLLPCLALAALAACSSGGGDPAPRCTAAAAPPCTAASPLPAGQAFTLGGTVEYDRVPAFYDPATLEGTLLFSAAVRTPVRNAVVQVRQCGAVIATTTTDAAGQYSVAFTPAAVGDLQVVALAKTESPPVQVEDNTDCDAVWAVGQAIDSAAATRDLHATHGWNAGTGSYDPSARIAAPFAILDAMYTAAQGFLAVGSPAFPPLKVNWSPDNVSSATADFARGLILTSHYAPAQGEIYVLGKAGDDTDEFDSHVIVHEWAHYFEDELSRSDSPGGRHFTGDPLDPRVAFSEGHASALAAVLLGDPIYADTWWDQETGLTAFGWDTERQRPPGSTDDPYPGPFSEMSIMRAVYDLWDDSGTSEPWDTAASGLGPIYGVLVGAQKETEALATIAPFVAALRTQVEATALDAVLHQHGIGPISDDWGTGDADLAAMYAHVGVPTFDRAFTLDGHYPWNMQPQNRYLVFTGPPGSSSVTVTSSSAEDVDLYAYRRGVLLDYDESPDGRESLHFDTTPGAAYVIVLTGYGYVDPMYADGSYAATVSITTP